MTNYQENIILCALSEIIRNEYSGKKPEKQHGLYLNNTWLTPEQCYTIAKVLKEHHDREYGSNIWYYDMPTIELLQAGTN